MASRFLIGIALVYFRTNGQMANLNMDKPSGAPPPEDISAVLARWCEGDQSALAELTPMVYRELHRLARHYMRRERPGYGLSRPRPS